MTVVLAMPALAHHGVAPHYDDSKQVTIDGTVVRVPVHQPAFVRLSARRGCRRQGSDLALRAGVAQRARAQRPDASRCSPPASTCESQAAKRARIRPAARCARRSFDDGSVLRSSTLFGATPGDDGRAGRAERVDRRRVGHEAVRRLVLHRAHSRPKASDSATAFDPIKDDPAIYCDPASPVRFWVNVNEPFEIKREANAVVVEHQFMDSRRVIHLDRTAPPAGTPRSTMGYSTGRFDGERARHRDDELRRRAHSSRVAASCTRPT